MARTPRPWYRGDKRRWYTTVNGKQVSLGVTDPADEARAWDALRQLVSGVVREAVTPGGGIKPGTVKDLVAAFLEEKKLTVQPRTVRGYGQHLGWLVKHWGSGSAAALNLAELAQCAAREEWSDTHRANVFWTANAFLRWCGRADKLPLPPKESRGADAVIPEDVHRRVLAETKGDFRALCQFLWLTGCRPGEATGLTAEAVDWAAGAVRLKKHKTRHKGKLRTLHLCAEAAQLLADQAAKYNGSGLLFRGLRGRPLSLQAMTMRFERLSERVGRKVTSYGYRHAYATRALAAGIPDAQVAALLGHASTAMLYRHYAHLCADGRLLRELAERVAGKAG